MSSEKKLIRERFRDAVYKRDRFLCRCCGDPPPHDAHHITDRNEMPNGGYVPENGITLCDPCHVKAETFHISEGATHVPGYHPSELYAKIGSSHEKAVGAAKKLGGG